MAALIGVHSGQILTEPTQTAALTGSPGKPARDPRKAPREGRGSVGDQAFMSGVIIVVCAWILLLILAYTLRHHNI